MSIDLKKLKDPYNIMAMLAFILNVIIISPFLLVDAILRCLILFFGWLEDSYHNLSWIFDILVSPAFWVLDFSESRRDKKARFSERRLKSMSTEMLKDIRDNKDSYTKRTRETARDIVMDRLLYQEYKDDL